MIYNNSIFQIQTILFKSIQTTQADNNIFGIENRVLITSLKIISPQKNVHFVHEQLDL